MKINLFVLGFPKCGTTKLCEVLNSCTKIDMPVVKETCFFSGNKKHGFEWLAKQYHQKDSSYRLEVCNHYIYSENAMLDIYNHNKDAKVIICVRNIKSRAISDLKMRIRWGKNLCDQRRKEIINRSNLKLYIEKAFGIFPQKNLHIFQLSRSPNDLRLEYEKLARFLNVIIPENTQNYKIKGGAFRSRFKFINLAKFDFLIATFIINSKYFNLLYWPAKKIRNLFFYVLFKKDNSKLELCEKELLLLEEYQNEFDNFMSNNY